MTLGTVQRIESALLCRFADGRGMPRPYNKML